MSVKKAVKKKKSQWISKETVKQIHKRGGVWREYRSQPSESNLLKYKVISNKVTSLVRKDHELHQKNLIKNFKGIEKNSMDTSEIFNPDRQVLPE